MGNLPSWAKGRWRACHYCGFEYQERDPRIRLRDGKWVCREDWDTVTEKERQQALIRRRQ